MLLLIFFFFVVVVVVVVFSLSSLLSRFERDIVKMMRKLRKRFAFHYSPIHADVSSLGNKQARKVRHAWVMTSRGLDYRLGIMK